MILAHTRVVRPENDEGGGTLCHPPRGVDQIVSDV